MERFVDPCCDKCKHTQKSPCKDFVICCMEGPICHDDDSCAEKRKAVVKKVALNEKFAIC